tara:strand:+ start:743 stop:1444 length:702 start_codon:yes stop_codon:yes gene_type:complete
MATTTVTATRQAYASSGTQTSWNAARNATSASSFINYTTALDRADAIEEFYTSDRGGGSYGVNRVFTFFDLSGIAGTITAMNLVIYGVTNNTATVRTAKSTAFGNGGDTDFVATDFDNWSPSSPTAYTSTDQAWTINADNTFTLNSTAITDANSDGYLNVISLGSSNDYPDTTPLTDITQQAGVRFQSSSNPLELSITYTPYIPYDVNSVAGTNINTINGVAASLISSINGVS